MIARVDGVPQAVVPVQDRGFLHGDSVFEVLRVHRGRPFLLPWHRERLEAGLAAFRFGDATRVWDDVTAVLADAGDRDGVLRIVVTRGEGNVRAPLASLTPRTVVTFRDLPPEGPTLRVTIVDAPRVTRSMPSAQAKYARYLPYLLANDDAHRLGFDEALLLDEAGDVAEAATANLFAVIDGLLVTPSLASGILAGITRRWIVENASGLGLTLAERALARAELARATEVFLSSSVRLVAPVVACDGTSYSAPGPTTSVLATALAAAM